MYNYLEQELQSRFNLFKLWQQSPSQLPRLFESYQNTIKVVVGDAEVGADAKLIDALSNLEIVAGFSVGFDKIDLSKCEEKGIRGLTDDVADVGIALIFGVLRKICSCDQFVRSGKWKQGDFGLTAKVSCSWSLLLTVLLSLLQ
ncbi:Hydroxyphenylpyruvate reductase [Linum grandiflorum]